MLSIISRESCRALVKGLGALVYFSSIISVVLVGFALNGRG